MVNLEHELINIDGRIFVNIRLPENISIAKRASLYRKNTLLFALAEHQPLRGSTTFEFWFVDDKRESYADANILSILPEEMMNAYIHDLRHEMMHNELPPCESRHLIEGMIVPENNFMYDNTPTDFAAAVLSVVLDVFGPGIKEYTWDQMSESDTRLNVHRIKTATRTYIRINTHENPLRIHTNTIAEGQSFSVFGIDSLNDMFLDLSESPEELFKIGVYALPPLLRQSRILREWRMGRELDIVEDFRLLPY